MLAIWVPYPFGLLLGYKADMEAVSLSSVVSERRQSFATASSPEAILLHSSAETSYVT